MRLLVGTLYTIENEFEECCAAIRAQTHTDFEHVIFQGLPNKQAHDALYKTFEQRSREFDLMIKIDADMVVEDRCLFEKIVARFTGDARLDWMCIKVHDFFCNRLIWGMNIYRNSVRWKYEDEHLFVDLGLDFSSVRRKKLDDHELAPAAIHCKNPSPFQAFHFGFHRGMKCVQPGRVRASREVLHWKIFLDVLDHYKTTRDNRVAYALAGFECALGGAFSEQAVSCGDPLLQALFTREFADKTPDDLSGYIRKKRLQRLAGLPYPFDFGIVYGIHRLGAIVRAAFRKKIQ